MNAYFFKMNPAEKNNILDQHKTVYDGYATNYGMDKIQPLFVQDFANDKNGITVNNKGNVGEYKNMNINESDAFTGAKYLPDESFDFGGPDEYVSLGEQKDMIGDGPDDLEHGTFGKDSEYELDSLDMVYDDDNVELCRHCNGLGYDEMTDEDCEWCDGTGQEDELRLTKHDEFPKTKWSYDKDIESEIDFEEKENLQENLNKTLDMFKRIIK